jgi:hypothetical protein
VTELVLVGYDSSLVLVINTPQTEDELETLEMAIRAIRAGERFIDIDLGLPLPQIETLFQFVIRGFLAEFDFSLLEPEQLPSSLERPALVPVAHMRDVSGCGLGHPPCRREYGTPRTARCRSPPNSLTAIHCAGLLLFFNEIELGLILNICFTSALSLQLSRHATIGRGFWQTGFSQE